MTAPAMTPTITIVDQMGVLDVPLELDLASTTPQAVIDHLLAEGQLVDRSGAGEPQIHRLARGTEPLIHDQPLGQQGVQPGDELTLITKLVKG